MIRLSTDDFDTLRNDNEFILYRGQSEEGASRVLVLAPAADYPGPESPKRLHHAYSLRGELDSAWAARPIGLVRQWERTVLLLEDPGGTLLESVFALRHAKSTAISVTLRSDPPNLVLKVKDNGIGITTKAETREGFGFVNMRARVKKLKGTLDIRTAPGSGTNIIVRLPFKQEQ